MTTQTTDTHKGRPTVQTPYGVLFSDTEAYSRYAEITRVRDWLLAFLYDMERLRIDAPTAVKRIDEFWSTLRPCHGGLKADQLQRIRACLAGDSAIHLSQQLTGLRTATRNHWCYSVGSAAMDCESVPTGQEIPYGGPFPRKSGDQTPAFGYHRALADSRY
jgi:hypothetical protein